MVQSGALEGGVRSLEELGKAFDGGLGTLAL